MQSGLSNDRSLTELEATCKDPVPGIGSQDGFRGPWPVGTASRSYYPRSMPLLAADHHDSRFTASMTMKNPCYCTSTGRMMYLLILMLSTYAMGGGWLGVLTLELMC